MVLGTLVTLALLGIAAFAVAYAAVDIPEPDDFAEAQTTTVFYADGATVMGTFGEQNRVIVDGDTIPQHVKDAVVAAEDRSFYENPGINPTGIVRALINNVRGGSRQGGSSITQQYAERYYIGTTVGDYRGKAREALLAVKLDRQQDKDQILSNYLNTIYYGRDSYGIETAARSYFGVGVADLTVSQAALLAGIIPSPNNWDPRFDAAKAEQRWNYVLDGMVETGALTPQERDAQVFPETIPYEPSDTFAGPQGYLLDMVRSEILRESAITAEELAQRGYRVVTTVDPALQQQAVEAATALPEGHDPDLRVGLVTLDPQDGAILALYGGPDFLTQSVNAVTQARAQAGSTFKPFTLVASLEAGNSLESRYSGENNLPVPGFPNDVVRNFGDLDLGRIDVVEATARSVNSVYVQMNQEVTPQATLDVAQRAGLADDPDALANQVGLANVLGPANPHPIDMAQAFNTFAAQGVRTEPFIVRTVEYLDGGLVYQGGAAPQRAFRADVMADTTHALAQVVESPRGTGRKAQAVGHPVAGKTGTSSLNRSAWFIGYTPQLTTAVVLYQPGPQGAEETITPFAGYDEITGGSVPLDIWTAYMTRAMEGREVLQFPERADVGERNGPRMALVPSVVGSTQAEARTALGAAGFAVQIETADDERVPAGEVLASDPAGGTEVPVGSTVTIVVSLGPSEPEPTIEPEPSPGPTRAPVPPAPTRAPAPTPAPDPEDGAEIGEGVDAAPRSLLGEATATVRG